MIGDTVREAVVESKHRGLTAFTLKEKDPQQIAADMQCDLRLLRICQGTMPRVDISRARLEAGTCFC